MQIRIILSQNLEYFLVDSTSYYLSLSAVRNMFVLGSWHIDILRRLRVKQLEVVIFLA